MARFGIKFPLTLKDGKLEKVVAKEKIEQAIRFVLTTYPGERWGMRDYGSNLLEYLFQPDSIFIRSRIRAEVERSLKKWIPEIQIEEMQIHESFEKNGNLIIRIQYTLGDLKPIHSNEVEINFLMNIQNKV
jgi:hypothetical protein